MRAGDAIGAHLSAADIRERARGVDEQQIDVAADEIQDRLPAAMLAGNESQEGLRQILEFDPGEVSAAADGAGQAQRAATWIVLQPRQQGRQVLRSERAAPDE